MIRSLKKRWKQLTAIISLSLTVWQSAIIPNVLKLDQIINQSQVVPGRASPDRRLDKLPAKTKKSSRDRVVRDKQKPIRHRKSNS